tara:strand:+ start:408 stop:1379 length:972 start_codon:yes stop_codon:yes gene_type:complete
MINRKFKKCLITGITGSGGSYLAEHIIKKDNNIKIFGFYRSKGYIELLKKKYKKKITFLKIDLLNYKKLRNKIRVIKPDVIFHLASNADVRDSFENPIKHTINNNLVTVNLLEAIRRSNISPIIMICSTSEVYGNVEKIEMPITEKQKIAPINPYAVTKVYQDLISQVFQKSFNMKIIITRMFSYTNARRINLFQTAFARQIVLCEKNKINYIKHGNLNSIRTFVDIEDAMEAYWLAAKKGKIGSIYNIGGNKIISVKNFLNELLKLSKKKIKTKLDSKLLRPQDINLQIPSSKKFKKDTGWRPKISFKDSVNKLLNDCRKLY